MSKSTSKNKEVKVKKINKQGKCVRNVGNWASVKAYHRFDSQQFNPEKLKSELDIISPKVAKLISNINSLDRSDQKKFGHKFKHFIFTDVKGNYGIKTVASSLIAHGFNLVYKPNESKTKLNITIDPETIKEEGSKNFAILTATPMFTVNIREDTKKDLVGSSGIYNSRPDNIHGQKIRFILGDSGFKEGVDLFDVKYVHILEPQLTRADLTQAIGRATRTCGQKGLQFVPNKGWTLEVFEYDLRIPTKEKKTKRFGVFTKSVSPKKQKTISEEVFRVGNVDVSEINTISDIQDLILISAVDRDLNHPINLFGKEEEKRDWFYSQLPENKKKSRNLFFK